MLRLDEIFEKGIKVQINYVSGEPGLGKTYWSIQKIVQNIQNRQNLTLYVAPTVALLEQVKSDIDAHLTPKQKSRVTILVATRGSTGTIRSSVKAYIEGGSDATGLRFEKLRKGSVLLLTHEGFLTLGHEDIPPKVKAETDVYFDEARKFVTQQQKLSSLTRRGVKFFDSLFEQYPYKDTPYRKLKLLKTSTESHRLLMEAKLNRVATAGLQSLIEDTDNANLEVYVCRKVNKVLPQVYGIRVPSKVFVGYREVWLLSAYFEYSQMYYLMKHSGITLVDKTTSLPSYIRRQKEVMRRYENVSLVPLTLETSLMSKAKKTRLLLPRAKQIRLDKKLERLCMEPNERRALATLIQRGSSGYALTEKQTLALKYIKGTKGIHLSPINWYVDSARRVIKHWAKSNSLEGTPLLFTNAHELEEAPGFKLVSTSSHGSNEYMSSNVVVYLAAIRLHRSLVTFLRTRLKGYDPEEDHMIDNCLQCIGRSSVRNISSKEPVLVILPDVAIARRVSERVTIIGGLFPKYASRLNDYVSYSPWLGTLSEANQTAKKREAINKHGSVDNYRKAKDKLYAEKRRAASPELTKTLSLRSYYRRKIKLDPSDTASILMDQQLTDTINELREQSQNETR